MYYTAQMPNHKVVPRKERSRTIEDLLLMDLLLARNEREVLLCYVLKLSPTDLILDKEQILPHKLCCDILTLFNRRISGVPLAYITGARDFYGRTFTVDRSVLIPRPETELMIDLVLDYTQKNPGTAFSIVDVGTGSGNIIITLAKELSCQDPAHTFLGVDISTKALEVASRNAQTHNMTNRISFICSSLLSDTPLLKEDVHSSRPIIIVANLPYVDLSKKKYICSQEFGTELTYEPDIALWAEDSGLILYKSLVAELKVIKLAHPTEKVYCLFEIDPSQHTLLCEYFQFDSLITHVRFQKDLSGHIRVCCFEM